MTSGSQGSAPTQTLQYRADIDGLRAIAVLAVVLYHFGMPGLSGGFVGVDIFFVISGYLIGGILWSEFIATGRIAMGKFYMRRIRRLAPAFFAMATATAVAAWFILLPFEFREFGKSLIAATIWLSNVQFWREAGYFDIGADSKVLLHTWSLSVEEQFYIFLPLFLMALRFLRKGAVGALILVWAASLAACIATTPTDPIASFFLFPFRAWEMMTGVLLAIYMRNGPAPQAAWLSWVGIALVLGSIFLIRSDGFPGWQALVPVAGTTLLLAGGLAQTPVTRVLAMRGPVFVGLISYSLYLWHWPVLVLSKYWLNGYENGLIAAGWLAVSVVLAILSWALVERPIRRATWLGSLPLLAGAIASAVVMLAIGGYAYVKNGVQDRFAPEIRGHIAASADFLQDWSRCSVPLEGPFAGVELCAIGPDGEAEVVIWGDSHLRALMNGFAAAAIDAETPGLIIWQGGCPPLFAITKDETAATPLQDNACMTANETLRAGFAELEAAERILLVGRWAYYANGSGTGDDAHNLITLEPDATNSLGGETQAEVFANALAFTVAELSSDFDSVHLFRQVPEIPHYSSREVARGLAHGHLMPEDAALLFHVSEEELAARVTPAERAIYPLVDAGAVTLIDPWPLLCPERCSVMQDGQPVYFDNNHLTNAGAMLLRPLFGPFLTGQSDG